MFRFLSQWEWMEFLSGRGYDVSVPSSAVCELINRWRRWRGVHPSQIWRGGGTDGDSRPATRVGCLKRNRDKAWSVWPHWEFLAYSCGFFSFFTPVFIWRPQEPQARFVYTPIRVQEHIRGIVWKVLGNVFTRLRRSDVVTFLFCRVNGVYTITKKWNQCGAGNKVNETS